MIWGQTKEQNDDYNKGHWWFAWYPVELDNGQIAWMQKVWRSRRRFYDFMGGGYFEYDYCEKPTMSGNSQYN